MTNGISAPSLAIPDPRLLPALPDDEDAEPFLELELLPFGPLTALLEFLLLDARLAFFVAASAAAAAAAADDEIPVLAWRAVFTIGARTAVCCESGIWEYAFEVYTSCVTSGNPRLGVWS